MSAFVRRTAAACGSLGLCVCAVAQRPPGIPPELSWQNCNQVFEARRRGGHEFREQRSAHRVRQIEGSVRSDAGPWPERALFQLFGPAVRPALRETKVGRDGKFRIGKVAPGDYCFEASAPGWDPVLGWVTVSPAAPTNRSIEVGLRRCPESH